MGLMANALSDLLDAIAAGAEFPDACGRVARKRRVSYSGLRDAYDDHTAAPRRQSADRVDGFDRDDIGPGEN